MRRIALLLALVLVALPLAAHAQWSDDPLVNLAIADRPSEQVVPKIAATADGGCYVAWFDLASGNYDVYLQHLDAAGNALWAHNGILVSGHSQNSSLVDWDLIADSEGNAVVVFTDARAGSDLDVYAYRVSPAGAMLWGADGLTLSDNTDYEPSPRVTQAADGDFVFIWARLPDVGDGKLMMQRVAPDGTLRFAAGGIAVAGEAGESPGFCDLVPSGADGVIVCWIRDISSFLSPRHLWAERFDVTGASAWGAPVVVYDLVSLPIAYYPQLLPDAAGGAVLLWHRSLSNLYSSLVQRLDITGTELWAHQGVAVSTSSTHYHISPTFTFDAATGATTVFWDERNTAQSQWGIAGQRFDAAGARLWGDGGRIFLPTDTLYKYALRALPAAGGALLFWIDEPGGFGSDRIRGVRVDEDGNYLWGPDPIGVATLPSGKSRLPVAGAPDGTALLIWEDDRGGTVDVYGQNVRPDGTLGGDLTAVPGGAPAAAALLGAYPNPFNPATTLRVELPAAGRVRVSILDLQGRRVRTLHAGLLPAGPSAMVWDGRDDAGRALPSALYLARVETPAGTATGKLLLLK
ncbi:MAG: hypothetical protein H6693_11775 [Candidatus Latescibacteria bacterium]|nr:hypothetical protein [Candidatus Latescibacterota bacterium]